MFGFINFIPQPMVVTDESYRIVAYNQLLSQLLDQKKDLNHLELNHLIQFDVNQIDSHQKNEVEPLVKIPCQYLFAPDQILHLELVC